jgi:hypothetical protein
MNKKYFLLILMVFSLVINLNGQQHKVYLDTLVINVENKVFITIATNDHSTLKNDKQFNSVFKTFQESTHKIKDEVPNKCLIITYQPGASILIKEAMPQKRFIIKDTLVTGANIPDTVHITCTLFDANIVFFSIDDMLKYDLQTWVNQSLSQLPEKGWVPITYHFEVKNSALTHKREADKRNGDMDQMSLIGGMGAGLVKNELVTDLSAEMGFSFMKKGIWDKCYYISDNLIYTFENNTIRLNNFINLGVRFNLSKGLKTTNWLGVDIGYLTNRNGTFFDKNTFKLGINWEIGKYMRISPQLYFSSGFGKIYPGIRIGFGL